MRFIFIVSAVDALLYIIFRELGVSWMTFGVFILTALVLAPLEIYLMNK